MTQEKETGFVPNINEIKFGAGFPLHVLHDLFKTANLESSGFNQLLMAIGDFEDPQLTCGNSPLTAHFHCSMAMLNTYNSIYNGEQTLNGNI